MEERYSILRPLTIAELHSLTIAMWDFFAPHNANHMRSYLSMKETSGTIQPLSLADFMMYLSKSGTMADPFKYMNQIICLAQKLSDQGVLIPAGQTKTTPGLGQCYYMMKEITTLQDGSNFWLGRILGENYLRELLSDFIVRIEGVNHQDRPGTGSGVLIAPDTILTCAHNIRDMEISSCWIGDNRLEILHQNTHEKYDVGIIKISAIQTDRRFPYLGPPYILDKTLTLGYPPLRGMREPLLLAQSGEINAIGSETFSGCECITISSITRPGNSGGPVFSMQGHIAGIVIEQAISTTSFGAESQLNADKSESVESPFYLAISSNALRTIIPEIDPSITVYYEDFQ